MQFFLVRNHDCFRDRNTGLLCQPLKTSLVMQAGKLVESTRERLHARGKVGCPRCEVKRLFKCRDDDVDFMLPYELAYVFDKLVGFKTRRCHQCMSCEIFGMAPDGAVVGVCRNHVVACATELPDDVESECIS